MRFLPTTNQEWFETLRFILKALIIFGVPAMFWCDHYLATALQGAQLSSQMRAFVRPTQLAYASMWLLLLGIGVVEWSYRRRRQAIVDFIFAVVAFFCIYIIEGLVPPLK